MARDVLARQLVRELAEKLNRGGHEAELAAAALGLLLERDRVQRWLATVGPALDEVIRVVFTPGLSRAPALSPVAVHEALLAVRELVDATVVTDPSLVRAMLGAIEPGSTPELAGRLGAMLEATHDDLRDQRSARRAVRDLAMAAYDARALAIGRLAEARGHRPAASGRLVLMLRKHPFASRELEAGADRLHRRPGHRELIANDGGAALLRIDPFATTPPVRIALPSGAAFRWWCFRADGALALVLPAGGEGAVVSLDGGAARTVAVPSTFERVESVCCLWDENHGVVAADDAYFYGIDEAAGTLGELSRLRVKRDNPAWTAMLRDEVRVLRTESAESRVLAFDAATSPAQLAAVDWTDESRSVRVPVHAFVANAAFDGARLYVLYEHEVHALETGGAIADIYAAPEGMYLRALEVVPAGDGQPPVLAAIAAALDGGGAAQLLLYELSTVERIARPTLESGRELVRRLAAAMAEDGREAENAAIQLALLVERDVAHRDAHSKAGNDDYLAKVYGAEVAAQRLSPVAIHEARSVLRARVRRERAPAHAYVFALNKARAATVPDLITVVEHTLADPALEPTAHQAVNGLAIHSHDPRAVGALRVAADQGHGEAKATAQRWLAVHTDPRPAALQAPLARQPLGARVSQLRRRPESNELIAAADDALLRLDPSGARPPVRIPLSLDVLAWCLRDDGERALVVSRGEACIVSLDDGSLRRLRAPSPHHLPSRNPFEDLRYTWSADRILFAAGAVRGYWRLDDDARFERIAASEVERGEPAWWHELSLLSPWSSRVLRTEPWRLIAYDGNELVVYERHDRRTLRVAAPYAPEVAFDGRFYVLDDTEVDVVDSTGDLVATFAAPEGMILQSLEVVAPHLAIIASPLRGGPSELLLYELPR